MAKLAELPSDMVFFTQITMEAAEDEAFLDAMRRANIKGALVGRRGRHTRRPEGRLQGLQRCPVTRWCCVCASSASTACTSWARSSSACRAIGPSTFDATADVAERAGLAFAQFVMLTPYPGYG